MVDLKNQYLQIKEEVDEALQMVIDQSAFIKGPFVELFAQNLSSYLGCRHLIPCANGTDALQLAFMALGLERGDEVITTPFTFVATAEVLVLMGIKPVFVDVELDSYNIDPARIEMNITERTRCILPVHLFGQSCRMNEILDIASKYKLMVVEDTAQSIGANFNLNGNDEFCGTMGDIGTFSFFPSKNLGCFGDGGALCTDDDDLAQKIELFANHGSLRKYYYDNIGINSRLDGLQAALLNVKLKYLDLYNKARMEAADRYDRLLADIKEIKLPTRVKGRNHVFHQYTITVAEKRDEVREYLQKQGIPTGVYYPAPLYTQSVYQPFKSEKEDYAITESLSNSVLSLPMHTELNEEIQNYITKKIREAFKIV